VQYPPYQHPPPPPPKEGLSGGKVALIVGCAVGVLGLFVIVPLGVGAYVGFTRARTRAVAATVDPFTVPLAQTYKTPNGLVTGHYPADFAAKTLDDATLVLSRNFDNGEDEVVTLAGVQSPITNDPHEFARILLALVDKKVAAKGGTSTKTSERDAMCLGRYKGVEVEGSFSIPGSGTYESKACFFIRGERGYETRYDYPRSRSAAEAPLLGRIVEATELAP
jgi:hypothetical protein